MEMLKHESTAHEPEDHGTRGAPAAAFRLRWELDDAVTSDGHRLRGVFACSARALDEPTERKMLEETFGRGASQKLTTAHVADHFRPALRATAAKTASGKTVEQWLAERAKEELITALRTRAHAVAFACGLEILPPYHLDLDSPSFQQQKLDVMQQQLAERRAAGQVQHFQRAAELLKQFHGLRESMPGLSAGQLLHQVSDADRGSMLQTLLLASAQETGRRELWLVAGDALVKVEGLRDAPVAPRLTSIPLPDHLGPLRSVQGAELEGRRVLLVGARSGVFVFDPESSASPSTYADDAITSARGFSRAVVWRDEIWACHGDSGVVGWKLDEPARPRVALRPGTNGLADPRHLLALDDRRLLVADERGLLIVDHAGDATRIEDSAGSGARDVVVALLRADRQLLLVVRADGTVERRDAESLQVLSRQRRCGAVTAAAAMPWLGSVRVLLATEDGPVCCVGLEDELLTQYVTPHRGLRMLAAAGDMVAGVSGDRQRLVLWQSWEGRAPAAELHVASVARHRVADVDFA
ncbi:MAG: hypothetical protein ACREIT_05370 [Tepidisphaeraceae bacterium]